MKVQNRKKEKSSIYGYLLSAAAMAAVIAISAGAMISFAGRTGSREEETLKKAVTRASVQCYAIEGRIRPAWNIWKRITGYRLTAKNTMCFMMALHPM